MSYPIHVTTEYIPPTTEGVLRTLSAMAEMARDSGPLTRQVAGVLLERGRNGFALRLRVWLREHWDEVPDPPGVEWVSGPELQLARAGGNGGRLRGDCDDLAVLAAALALAAGFQARYRALVFPPGRIPSHVYTDVVDPGDGTTTDMDILDVEGDSRLAASGVLSFDV